MSGKSVRGRRGFALRLAAGTAVALASAPALATTRTWNTTSGSWSTATDWTPNGVPAAGDSILIEVNDSAGRTVTYDYTGAAVTLANLTIDNDLTGTNTLSMAANNLTVGNPEQVGFIGNGAITQSGGVNNIAGGLELGVEGTGIGNYTLSGTGTLTDSSANGGEIIGFFGTGTFTQTGGINSVSGSGSTIVIADTPGSHGAYNLSGGSATAPAVFVGTANGGGSAGGTGILSVTGGSLTTTGGLSVSAGTGSAIVLGGGSITAGSLNTSGIPSNFGWTGGTLTLTNQILNFDSANLANSPLGSSRTLSSGQTLNVNGGNGENIGGVGSGSLTVNNGAVNTVVGSNVLVNPPGSLTINLGGTVTDLSGLTNQGTFVISGGTFNGTVTNQGSMNVNANPVVSTISVGLFSSGSLFVANGAGLVVNSTSLDNTGSFQISGGSVSGSAAIINDYGGNMYAAGSLNGPSFTNNGTLNLTGTLNANSTTNTNNGVINVPGATALTGSGGNITNNNLITITAGAVNLPVANHGVIQGGGGVFLAVAGNDGVIAANNLSFPLSVNISGTNAVVNNPDGQMRVADGCIMNVATGLQFVNNGTITMQGPNAVMNGLAMGNFGTIQGQGRISNAVTNSGIVAPGGGQLTFAGSLTNAAAGQIQAPTGATAAIVGASANSGTVALNGGTFDNGVSTFTNNSGGFVVGNGTFKSGGLTNNGTLSFADSPTSVFGAVTNNASLKITSNTTTFFGAVTNAVGATIKVSTGTSRFLTTFTNNGTFNSDPAVNEFASMAIGPEGVLLGGSGDQFIVSGDLINTSTRNAAWNTAAALISFTGGPAHTLAWSGINQGASYQGYVNNFAIGALELSAGNTLTLEPGGAIYVGSLLLDGRPADASQLAAYIAQAISNSGSADPTDIYYDPGQTANAYLNDSTYVLGNGGVLSPVPEPASLSVVVLLAPLVRRRRAQF
jgi:hypothetical protein